MWLVTLSTRGTYVRGGVGWGGWGGVFKDVVVGHVEHAWNFCMGWGGVGGVFKDVVVGHVEHTWNMKHG